tara:strand:+ start:1628 stop:1819 length:192 start_codon:yes stop_codon:yes gene_type:complete
MSTSILVPVGMYPRMLLIFKVSIAFEVVNEVPIIVALVEEWLRSSYKAPSPKLLILWRVLVLQ